MAEDNIGKKISELGEYPGGLQKAMEDDAVFPVAAKVSNFKIFLKEIKTMLENKIQAAREAIEDLIDKEAARSIAEDSKHDGQIAGLGNSVMDLYANKQDRLPPGDIMQLLKGNLTWTPGYVDFVHKLEGDYANAPNLPSAVSYMILMSNDKREVFIVCSHSCDSSAMYNTPYIKYIYGRRNGSTGKFTFNPWNEVVSDYELNGLKITLTNDIDHLRSRIFSLENGVFGTANFKSGTIECLRLLAYALNLFASGDTYGMQNALAMLNVKLNEMSD
ncbi:MAG: hypothetical protein LBC64_01930 [Fibromonadaceae bacterium]|jgi:hypothetical protein|nr:hypothetical protein [Fibromonadaceae bacterium]